MADEHPRGSLPSATTRRWLPRLTAQQVNVALGVLTGTAIVTGIASFAVALPWSAEVAAAHAVAAFALVPLVPAKLRSSVRAGFTRGRTTRFVSALFGVVVLAALVLGILHATGIWYGVGPWSALWTHALLGYVAAPLLVWHVVSRPVRARLRSVSRRRLLRAGLVAGGAAVAYAAQDTVARVAGLDGPRRRSTGSYELASGRPERMPSVIWLFDRRPADTDADGWSLTVQGRPVELSGMWDLARPVVATLDCTGGWFSEQVWDAVPLSELVERPSGASVLVRSATGYQRRTALDQLADVHLAVGYGGRPLAARHGAPVRLVVPGRRGPEWVKWVAEVTDDPRPAWLEPPLPLS